jgi:hypothetical protein
LKIQFLEMSAVLFSPRLFKKELHMKKAFFAFMAASLLTACSSPVLRWIDTPGEKEAQSEGGGRIAGLPGNKEIVSFTFDIPGETVLPFGTTPDSTGKIPISIILPMDTPLNPLTPAVTFIGKSLTPPSGEPGNFSSPVVYTVSAEDGTSRDYMIHVYPKGSDTKAIIRFALDLAQTGFSTLTAEGVIDEAEGQIIVSVPGGTNTGSLTAQITHTGIMAQDPRNGSHPDETFLFTGDFSAPAIWTVTAQDRTTKTYTVTVIKEKRDDKEIKSFSLGLGEEVIIGGEPQPDGKYPILAVIPAGTSSLTKEPAFINYTGMSISPGPAVSLDFDKPVTYIVTAENRSTRDYVVKTVHRELSDASALITGFYIMDPLVEGVIDQAAKTIALQVPSGTDLRTLRPEIYYTGASVSPLAGQVRDFTGSDTVPVIYTVWARDGASNTPYQVSVFVLPNPAQPTVDVPGTEDEQVSVGTNPDGTYNVIIEFPVYIDHPTVNIQYPGLTAPITINENNYNYNYEKIVNIVTVGDEYQVVVVNPPENPPAPPTPPSPPAPPVPLSPDAFIDAFYFTNPAAIGEIGKTDGTEGAGTPGDPYTITVTVPPGTNLRNLGATICYTGKEIVGIPGPNPLKDNARSFQNPVLYTVKAEDGSAKTYQVTAAAAPNNAKKITALSFTELPAEKIKVIISAGPTADTRYPIEVRVPEGTDLGNLTPQITITGVELAGYGFAPAGPGPGTVEASAKVDFSGSGTNPVIYTVKAEDGSSRDYAVTVLHEEPEDDSAEITGFYFTQPLAVGTINGIRKTITVAVPSGTNRGSLSPAVFFKGASVKPGSGSAVNFNGPVTYTVTGISGRTVSYTVVVTPTPSSAKDITRFQFPGIVTTETIIGAVAEDDGTYPISVWLPSGTDLGSLAPGISHTGVSISPEGGIPQNFYGFPRYTVLAEDGSTKTYKVRVYTLSGGNKIITSCIFDEVPVSGGAPPVRVVASIDQTAHTIQAVVPRNADITSGLKPTLTWIGKVLKTPGNSSTTANPFTDTARIFTGSLIYTVEDQDGGSQGYTVTVIPQSSVTVSFTGDPEEEVIRDHSFDKATGLISVTVNSDNVGAPYEWYVNGVKQPVSGSGFSLQAGDGSFIPGQHEIMVSGTKNGLHYTGKVYFVVSGGGL